MAIVTVNLVDTFDEWRVKTNSISTNGGDLTTLTTTNKSSLVNALNEIKTTATGKLEHIVEDLTPKIFTLLTRT